MNGIYIRTAAQISAQKPLCEDWMHSPVPVGKGIAPSEDPDFRRFFSPMEGRRMGRLMKRALATSLSCLDAAGVSRPDAIVTGTGMGCIEHTEAFMDGISGRNGAVMKPTHFMQSTHNTLSSLIAIKTGSHCYNATYSHRGVSFESALEDAVTQMGLGRISNALVGCFDEITPEWAALFGKIGFAGEGTGATVSEAAVSFFLDCKEDGALCRFGGMRLAYRPSAGKMADLTNGLLDAEGLALEDINAVVAGYDGNLDNDVFYDGILKEICPGVPVAMYRHIFGESFSASALGVYVGAVCIRDGFIPDFLGKDGAGFSANPENVLVVNHSSGKDVSVILLRKK
ncbi:MAG: beta-ketoacyl synthase chain length factor [Candidatus Cryptobacteroides sp.]